MADGTPQRPLSRGESLLYCAGELGPNAVGLIVPSWVLYLYRGNPEAGLPVLVPGLLFSAVFVCGRFIDAVSDPLVGHWSDATRTRWGRRKPFLTVSLGPLALCFLLLWLPPVPAEAAVNGLWLLLCLSGFYLAFTGYYAPYLALLPELTPTDRERNGVSTLQAVFKVLAMIGASCFGLLYGALAGGDTGPHRLLRPALVFGLVTVITGVLPLLGRPEAPPAECAGPRPRLRENLAAALASRPFRHFTGGFLLTWLGLQLLMAVLPQVPYARLGAANGTGEGQAAIMQLAAMLGGAACFPLLLRVMARRGRGWTYTAALIWFAVVIPWLAAVRSLTQAVLVLLAAGPAVAGFLVLPHALMADVCDEDQRRTGVRREAIFFGVQGLIVKAGASLAVPLADRLLTGLGQSAERPGGVVACFLTVGLASALALLVFRGFDAALRASAAHPDHGS